MQNRIRQGLSSIRRGDKLVINTDTFEIMSIKQNKAYCESCHDWAIKPIYPINNTLLKYINIYFNTYLT